jgi:hypothetical protein
LTSVETDIDSIVGGIAVAGKRTDKNIVSTAG